MSLHLVECYTYKYVHSIGGCFMGTFYTAHHRVVTYTNWWGKAKLWFSMPYFQPILSNTTINEMYYLMWVIKEIHLQMYSFKNNQMHQEVLVLSDVQLKYGFDE